MPQFFFAVGFAFRLTFLKRLETVGQRAAMLASLRRNLGLILVGVVLYHLDGEVKSWEELQKLGLWGFLTTSFTREPFQTLVHIALASLLVTPIIGSRPRVRVVALFAFGLLHLLLSYWFYFEYAWKRPVIDGGPLGFLTWSIPVLVGSLAYDAMVSSWTMPGKIARLLGGAIALCAVGYGLSCLGTPGHLAPPPFVAPEGEVNLWTMSQRTGSLSYQVFAAGFSLVVYALVVILTDMAGLETGIFRTFGRTALGQALASEGFAALVLGDRDLDLPRDQLPVHSQFREEQRLHQALSHSEFPRKILAFSTNYYYDRRRAKGSMRGTTGKAP